MDALFLPLADAVGASVGQIKLISCLLISYPLGSLFVRIPPSYPSLRHLFCIGVTFFYLVGVLDLWTAFLQLLVSVIGTYAVAAKVQGPRMPWIVFGFVMGHLLINHSIRAIFNLSYETIEVTGPQMVLTMKLTTFAWNVWDGRRPVADLDKWQLEKRVTEYPSLLAFLGYAFYFPGFLVGPYLDYTSYIALIDATIFVTPKGKEKENTTGRRVPKGRKRVAYRKMIFGLFFLGIYVVCIGRFHYGVALEDWFVTRSLPYRIIYFQICGFFERAKYYAIWSLTEGASILTGLGFTGYDSSGGSLWEGAANINIPLIEFSPNFKVLLDSWNIKTNIWLRECVYKRVTPAGTKPGFKSSMITFATSAFWHGVSGGYYLTFLMGGFVQTVGRLCRANVRPLFLPPTAGADYPVTTLKQIYDIVGTICAILVLNFIAAPFMLLGIGRSLKAWSNLGWYGVWMIGGSMAFFYLGGKDLLKSIQVKRVKAAADAKIPVRSGTLTPGPYTVPPVDMVIDRKFN